MEEAYQKFLDVMKTGTWDEMQKACQEYSKLEMQYLCGKKEDNG